MAGQAAEGQGADGNGNLLRIGAAGGPFTIETGQTNYYGKPGTKFAQAPLPPLRTRPAYPNSVPALQRSAPCYTQPVPDVNGPAATGPADGSRPDAAAAAAAQRPDREDRMSRTIRELRAQLRTILLMLALAILGLAVGAYLVVHQRIVWPSWVPVLGTSSSCSTLRSARSPECSRDRARR